MTKKKVLAIDDERIVLNSVRKILNAENFEVDVTLSGFDGIQYVQKSKYDIVLTDVRMPDISGKIVLREVKRIRPTLPVVIISGFATVQSAIQCMRLGAATVLEKPFTPEELTAAVSHALKVVEEDIDEEHGLVHDKEILNILNRAARNSGFTRDLAENEAASLESYALTVSEKLALLTGDVEWFEQYFGVLDPEHKRILNIISNALEYSGKQTTL